LIDGALDVASAVRWATDALDGARDDALRIVEAVLGCGRSEVLVRGHRPVTLADRARLEALVRRRASGEPLQYVVGSWGFRSLDLLVDQRVLIPRPETEEVVSAAIAMLPEGAEVRVLDLGTGSGAIALAIALEVPHARVTAVDASSDALDVARANADALVASTRNRVRFLTGSWFDALPPEDRRSFDLVVSNPPYVAEQVRGELSSTVVDWEPSSALFAGPDGLDDVRVIVGGAVEWLRPGGALVVEIGADQGEVVRGLARAAGLVDVTVGVDLTGRDRWVSARRA